MAARKSTKRTAKKTARKTGGKTARTSARKSAKTATKKRAGKSAKKSARPSQPKVREGRIAHTEFASTDPAATKAWAQKTFGWKFGPSMPTPTGDYHMWDAGDKTGGGIRTNQPSEPPGTIPYVEVPNIQKAWDKAIQHGAKPMMPPEAIGGNMGWIAIVSAPGGPAVGLWAPG